MQVIIDKLLINYSEIGKGKQIILFLHGWADAGKTFESLSKHLVAEDKRFKAVKLDLPGFGSSQNPAEAWGLHEYAVFVGKFIAKTGLSPSVVICHSNGGAIAINGLANHDFKADKLVLIASAGIRNPSVKKEVMRLMAKPAKLAINITPPSTQRRIRQKLYKAIGSDYLVAEHMQETFKKVVSTDVRADAGRLKVPTCLIYGDTDTATPISYGKLLADAIPGASLHTIPLAGHFVHQEQVYKVANIILEFLK